MPAYPRCKIIKQDRVGVYHVTTRCVQQMFLLGMDYLTGNDYGHRKSWIITWLKSLADVFLVDVCAFSILDNHVHLILRNRPDQLEELSDQDVANRLARLYSGERRLIELPEIADPDVVKKYLNNRRLIKKKRGDLTDISVFMKVWEEAISRRANKEMKKTGHFWQGRFSSQVLEDDAAILACCAYVDLNPFRAGIVHLPELSEFTSLRIRLQESISRLGENYASPVCEVGMPDVKWLAPIFKDENESSTRSKSALNVSTSEYFQLLDEYSRKPHRGKETGIDPKSKSILERVGICPNMWLVGIKSFGKWFQRVVGKPESIRIHNEDQGRHWSRGITNCKALFSGDGIPT
ncbi:MAG: transposase [Pirellulaceae bacterium]